MSECPSLTGAGSYQLKAREGEGRGLAKMVNRCVLGAGKAKQGFVTAGGAEA